MFHFSHLRLQRRQAASLCSVTTVKYSIRVAQHWCSDLASFATKPIALCRRAHTMPTPVTETACVAGVRKMVDDIVVSANDKRKYRGLELDNGMTVLVVHDENATKAAAALDVRVGEFENDVINLVVMNLRIEHAFPHEGRTTGHGMIYCISCRPVLVARCN